MRIKISGKRDKDANAVKSFLYCHLQNYFSETTKNFKTKMTTRLLILRYEKFNLVTLIVCCPQ